MKKIFIMAHSLEIGGAERSLLGLLENIDTTQYQVDLFLLRHQGELMKYIPENINLLPEIPEYTVLARPIKDVLKERHFLLVVARLYGKYKAKVFDKKNKFTESAVAIEYSHKYTKKFMPAIQSGVNYDVAISFLTPHYFVNEKVQAKRKIAWIHTDYSVVKVNEKSELKMWSAYDYIASISEDVTSSFLKAFPSLKNKIVLIENILPKSLIEKQSQESVSEKFDTTSINLLSIGRFSSPKNFDNVPDICKRILEKGINAKWYLIGYGGDEKLIRQKIAENGVEDSVIILGKKENPYPYIKMCDIYVQPSRYEGKCVAVREAQMLGKTVVITNYATSASQLEDGVDGIIVPLDNAGCADKLAEVIKSNALRKKIAENVLERDYTNNKEIEKINKLVNGQAIL